MNRRTFIHLFGLAATPLAAGPSFLLHLVRRRNARIRPHAVLANTCPLKFDGTDDRLVWPDQSGNGRHLSFG